jgi:catalase
MRFFEPLTGNVDAYYEPNSVNGAAQDNRFNEPPLKISGDADRYNHRNGNDDYRQPGDLFRLIGAEAQGRLMDNIAEAMHGVPVTIVKRQIVHFYKADPDYGIGVATRLGLSAADLPSASAAAAE